MPFFTYEQRQVNSITICKRHQLGVMNKDMSWVSSTFIQLNWLATQILSLSSSDMNIYTYHSYVLSIFGKVTYKKCPCSNTHTKTCQPGRHTPLGMSQNEMISQDIDDIYLTHILSNTRNLVKHSFFSICYPTLLQNSSTFTETCL